MLGDIPISEGIHPVGEMLLEPPTAMLHPDCQIIKSLDLVLKHNMGVVVWMPKDVRLAADGFAHIAGPLVLAEAKTPLLDSKPSEDLGFGSVVAIDISESNSPSSLFIDKICPVLFPRTRGVLNLVPAARDFDEE